MHDPLIFSFLRHPKTEAFTSASQNSENKPHFLGHFHMLRQLVPFFHPPHGSWHRIPMDPGWIAVIYIISWTAYAIHFLWALRRRVARRVAVVHGPKHGVGDRQEWVDHLFFKIH